MRNGAVGIATQLAVMAIVISVMLLFIGIGLVILIHVCIIGGALRRGLSPNNQSGSNNRNTGISQDELERLPSFSFKGLDRGSSPIDCAVCLESFRPGEICRMLPMCRHSFHAQCVDSWLLRTPICPICRTGAATSGEGMELVNCRHIGGVRFEPGESEVVVGIPVSASPSPLHGPLTTSAAPSPLRVSE